MIGCPRAAAAVTGCMVREDRRILPHLAVRTHFQCSRWVSRVSQPVQRAPLWPASWLPVLDKSRGFESAEVQSVWAVYDDRLQFAIRDDALNLDEALRNEDVSRAWDVWSSAAEAALADAYQLAGSPVPERGLVLGRGSFLVRTARLGDPKVREARRNFADPQDEVMCLCIMTLLLHSCLIAGVGLRLWECAQCDDSRWDYFGSVT